MYKIGIGYDSHRFASDTSFILGGIELDIDIGLKGHSDADVLIHAIIDSLLGASGEEDIGTFFPDTESKYKNISSMILLNKVYDIINQTFEIVNIDTVIIAEKPKLKDYKPKIRENVANSLNIDMKKITIKAKTNEGLGFIGREEGIAVISNVLLKEKK